MFALPGKFGIKENAKNPVQFRTAKNVGLIAGGTGKMDSLNLFIPGCFRVGGGVVILARSALNSVNLRYNSVTDVFCGA